MPALEELLAASAAMHHHLCPRQVLGVRMGLLAGKLLGLTLPQTDKRLVAIVETDGCATDGVAVATGCRLGRRTMWVFDFGKVAATFVDTASSQAWRIAPSLDSRRLAYHYAPEAESQWQAYLLGYQRMPELELLQVQQVRLTFSLEWLLGREGDRVNCECCGEEIMNQREVIRAGSVLCRSCAGEGYYQPGQASLGDCPDRFRPDMAGFPDPEDQQ
jgi:formylmethanofuran dehydrogenase subunit E